MTCTTEELISTPCGLLSSQRSCPLWRTTYHGNPGEVATVYLGLTGKSTNCFAEKKAILCQSKEIQQLEEQNNNYFFFQTDCRRQIRRGEWQYLNNNIEEGMKANNTKPFRRYVRAKHQDNIGVAPLKEETHPAVSANPRLGFSLSSFSLCSPEMMVNYRRKSWAPHTL